jgi:NitT/TauT family transport system permease protein
MNYKQIFPFLLFLGVLFFWEILVVLFGIPAYLLPKPSLIIFNLINNISFLLTHLGITGLEVLVGYLIGNIVAFLLAIIFIKSNTIRRGLFPYAIAIKATPIIAIAPLFVLWFGTNIFSKIILVALVCFFPMLINAIKGLESVNKESLELFSLYNASWFNVLLNLRIPTALPYIFSALKISTGLAIVGALVGEFVGANSGIGFIILVSSYQIETTTMFAAIVLTSLMGVMFFEIINYFEKKIIFWESH